jgi:hypothetical protein
VTSGPSLPNQEISDPANHSKEVDASISRHPTERRKWSIDVGWATLIAGALSALAVLAASFYAGTRVPASAPAAPPALTTAQGPARVTINLPLTGDIHHLDSYSGKALNLKPGQLVWTFNQSVSKDGSFSTNTYPDSGPCMIDYKQRTWSCPHIYVGNPNDNGTYRVCAAILNASDAFTVVELLRNTLASVRGYKFWFTSPPSYIDDKSPSCMSVHRVN